MENTQSSTPLMHDTPWSSLSLVTQCSVWKWDALGRAPGRLGLHYVFRLAPAQPGKPVLAADVNYVCVTTSHFAAKLSHG